MRIWEAAPELSMSQGERDGATSHTHRLVDSHVHWSITGRFTGPVTGTIPVNVLLAKILPHITGKTDYCPVTGVPVLVKNTLLASQ